MQVSIHSRSESSAALYVSSDTMIKSSPSF
jgi:hypothetical protein